MPKGYKKEGARPEPDEREVSVSISFGRQTQGWMGMSFQYRKSLSAQTLRRGQTWK
uniref:Uncharacterized protein n=1 Tax=Oryza sativa subsp. japonica TaxID=39947 RepID=Q5VRL5_ORYSJ|nr:hypothetical protein [Oryza sativa Japonica Group]